MNQRIKKLWIKALRSGKYKQGQGGLRPSKDTFCCLGVLCDVQRREGYGQWRKEDGAGEFMFTGNGKTFEGSPATGILPLGTCEWAGLPDEGDPKLGRRVTAANLNDEGKNFDYIADKIEKYL
jgi:hypothetical protein